jgi:hypothetical protein
MKRRLIAIAVLLSAPAAPQVLPPVQQAIATQPSPSALAQVDLFAGGSESLVARAVGHAEGTRSVDGGKNPGYYGHTDPGDGKPNLGTFSYSPLRDGTSITTPEAADAHYIKKLKDRYETLKSRAAALGLSLTLPEKLNAIDLSNQAPLAVTDSVGFVERLKEAKRKNLKGDDATLYARVWAFWDDKKGGFDAPGLRAYDDISKEESVRRDQDRRLAAIAAALDQYTKERK